MNVDLASETPPITGEARPPRRLRRVIAGSVAAGCATVLGIAASLTASPDGLGTHQALNMRECGWITALELPCPTCGMTTAFTHAADGNLWMSFKTQPMGAILALATTMTLILCIHVVLTGSSIFSALASLWTRKLAWTIAGFALVAWLYKILTYRGIL